MSDRPTFTTRSVRAGLESDDVTGAVVPPIHLSSTYAFRGYGDKRAYDYSRSGNPTRDLLGNALADLEGGAGGIITGTGMGAITLVGHLLPQGARIVAPHDCYGGTFRLFTAWNKRNELKVDFVRFADEAALDAALAQKTDMLWIETPSNPLLRITDIAGLAKKVKGKGTLVVVDNTFLSPAWQRPIELGADIVVHSTTKYIGGHSDVVGGALVTNDEEVDAAFGFLQNGAGAVPGPFDASLTMRGLKTLPLRMQRHSENASAVAEFLSGHPAVTTVLYPGLPDHPGHQVAARQMRGFGGMISIRMAGGIEAARRLCARTGIFILAESLGGVESLIEHPGAMTHASTAGSQLEVPADLVRLSVGIEDVADLVSDLEQALDG